MAKLSISDTITLIKSRSKLAKDIREEFDNADLTDLVKHYNRAVREVDDIPSSTEEPEISDPIELKTWDGNLEEIDMKGIAAPDVTADVDRKISPENLMSTANLYACYQFDQLGVFQVVQSIFGDFFHGNLRISTEPGALALYRYEKRKKERYPKSRRYQVYKRCFNYGPAKPPAKTAINRDFHKLLVNFVTAVTRFYRDQRISEVIRKGATGLQASFGSLEMVKKAGIDLRNTINRYSAGITMLFTMELSSYLNECLEVLRLPEIQSAYNVKNEWQLIEKIGEGKLKKPEKASVRGSLAQEGKRMLEWLAGDDVLEEDNIPFEITLNMVGQWAERWAISYKSLGRA
ncbi:MAG: hypothetical protein ACYTDW_01930 [Planctomycetota bacterium]|jgi:hypothetical protein